MYITSPRAARPLRKPGPGCLLDVDRVTDLDPVEQVDHVGDGHPDAAVRGCRAERASVVRPVDPRAVIDAHPAGHQRVPGARRDVLARERPRPGGVRNVPGRIDLLGLDRVLTDGRVVSTSAD